MKDRHSILIIEDEPIAREIAAAVLEDKGHRVVKIENGKSGILYAIEFIPDLILLDLGLPDMDGAEIAKTLKRNQRTENIMILVLSSRDDDKDVIAGLEDYADDYITKPYKEEMLAARVAALLRRKNTFVKSTFIKHTSLKIDELVIDPAAHQVEYRSKIIALSRTEFDILYILASRPGMIYTREQITSITKGDTAGTFTDRAVDMSISRIRTKLQDARDYIETVRGTGYRFKKNTMKPIRASTTGHGKGGDTGNQVNTEPSTSRRATLEQMFQDEMNVMENTLSSLLSAGSFEEIAKTAHKHKSSSGMLGYDKVYEILVTIEQSAADGDLNKIRKQFDKLKQILHRTSPPRT